MSEQTNTAASAGDASDPTAPLPGGNRAIDRVLSESYLADLQSRPLAEVRELRAEADQEEADLSYLRRMLQGRLDIVRAELARRDDPAAGSLVASLPRILAEQTRAPAHGLGRYSGTEPQRVAPGRRRLEALAHDVDVSDVASRSEEELREAIARFSTEEQRVSARRRAVQQVVDSCGAEITRRYREGEADVSDLLAES